MKTSKFILKNFSFFLLKLIPITVVKKKKNELIIYVNKQKLYSILYFLNKNTQCQFKILSDLCAIDLYKQNNRFLLVYNLLSITYNTRIRIKSPVNEFDKIISIKNIFKTSNWFEREIFDMFGLYFKSNNDLRRILTDYGFEGFPLRKDFPVTGYLEIYYNEKKNKIIYKNIKLNQNFRYFTLKQFW